MGAMRLILNGINGRYLREITDNAAQDTEYVEAAVAYVTHENLVFDWCWSNHIPLRFWGRFDEIIPVTLGVLRTFLKRKSPNYSCKLLTHFHAKVIWWHGYGAYVGSANLTDAAWYGNIEAGCFFDEAEMEASSMDLELRTFFGRVDRHASPLTEEILKAIETRARELQGTMEKDRERSQSFLATPGIHQWKGLLQEPHNIALNRQKAEFLGEWYESLQHLRNISSRVSSDENRPVWIPENVPAGAQADQFLHGYYYNHVIGEGGRSRFAELYEANKGNPEQALRHAVDWWHNLQEPPSGEDRTLLQWAPFLRSALSQDRILGLSEGDFEAVCQRVWSIQDHARRVANATLNLQEGQRYDMATKTRELSKFLFSRRSGNGSSILQVLYHVLYDGAEAELANRLWEATTDDAWRIEHVGISALGELIGWALPDKFPPRNNRTSKALRALGFPVTVHG
jgi:hypothetical protein